MHSVDASLPQYALFQEIIFGKDAHWQSEEKGE
jgi:hypothetical protein